MAASPHSWDFLLLRLRELRLPLSRETRRTSASRNPATLVVHRGHDEALVALVVCRHFRQPNGFYEVVV
jgi:hypothetical protein